MTVLVASGCTRGPNIVGQGIAMLGSAARLGPSGTFMFRLMFPVLNLRHCVKRADCELRNLAELRVQLQADHAVVLQLNLQKIEPAHCF